MGMVSHDLRNLLHGIVLQTTMLSEDASASTDNKDMVVGLQRILGCVGSSRIWSTW